MGDLVRLGFEVRSLPGASSRIAVDPTRVPESLPAVLGRPLGSSPDDPFSLDSEACDYVWEF